jgi:tight adherence protein B
MDRTSIIFSGILFLFAASLVLFIYFAWMGSKFAQKQLMRERLQYISAGGMHGKERLMLRKTRLQENAGAMEKLLFSLPRNSRLDGLLLKGGFSPRVSLFFLFSVLFACLGFILGYFFLPPPGAAMLFALLFLFAPYGYLLIKEKKFLQKFDEQLPEALDLLARAVRSGHSIASGFELIAGEMEEPIKSEFRATVDEISMGLSLKDAFDNLCTRVPSTDLRFFAIALLIQKETGGNIAEILDRIGRLIRERLQFKRQVRALTAEGRLSAWVLILLPLVMLVYMYFVNYDYVSQLWTEKMGLYMLTGGFFLQCVGAFVIRRIVTIDI